MRNLKLAALFNEVADLLEIKGENPYRIRAYRRAAEAIQLLGEDVKELVDGGRLEEVKGIGKGLAAAVREWVETGQLRLHQELVAEIPRGVLELLALPGVGPKTAAVLHREAGITSLEALEAALLEGRLRGVRGIGPKTEEALRQALVSQKERTVRTPIGVALPLALDLERALEDHGSVSRAAVAGSLRRGRDTCKDIDLVAGAHDARAVMTYFISLPPVQEVLQHGDSKASVRLYNGLQADLRVVEPAAFPAAWHHFTGSQAHHVRLRERARRLGVSVNEYGVTGSDGRRVQPGSEEELYELLGLPFIPPELREDRGEIEAAERGALPDLVRYEQLQGDLHVHTNWSDGRCALEDVVIKALERGWQYIAITDHSPFLKMTRGLDPARLRLQAQEIAALNERYPQIRILRGIEVDILPDGSLDLPDEVLAQLDVVVASVHSRFQQSEEEMTRRLIRAMENPHVDIIGHPTGRLLGRRDPYQVNIEALCEAAVRTQTVLEVNSSPERLDLRDEHVRQLMEAGGLLAVNSDLHQPGDFDSLRLGVATARRGWAQARSVINTWEWRRLLDWLERDR